MSCMTSPIEIRCSEAVYRGLTLLLTGGDFASGQRWFTETTDVAISVNSFAEGMETERHPYEV